MTDQIPADAPEKPKKGARKGKRRPPGKGIANKRILAQERQRKALELRKSGATYAQIAEALGYSSPSVAYSAVKRGMEGLIQEPGKEVLALQIERVNHMLLPLWSRVQTGDTDAIRTATMLMDRLDKYMGLDKVTHQLDVNVGIEGAILVVEGNEEDYVAQMKRMIGVSADGINVAQTTPPPAIAATAEELPDEDEILDAEIVETPKPRARRTLSWTVQPKVS